jgi:catechol 2,3-dioxygenase-like lactoylglutathione lyase family enzyme
MSLDPAIDLVKEFESGRISRRQLAARLLGLGAAMASVSGSSWAQQSGGQPGAGEGGASQGDSREGSQSQPADAAEPTFQATGLNHIALDVTDMPRSRDFYVKHLGLRVIRGDDRALFLGQGREFFLTLFRREQAGFHHYCYSIPRYEPDAAFAKLADAGLRPRREGQRIYFPDPDGYTVQIAQERARP